MPPDNYRNNRSIGQKYHWVDERPTDAHRWIVPMIMELLPKNKGRLNVLDIGCGNGFIAASINKDGFDVIGIDTSEEGIRIAQKAHPDIRFKVASAYDDLLAVADDVDVIVAADLIEHLYSPRLFIENAFAVLKPGGMLIVATPYHGYAKNLALSLFNKWDFHHTANWEGGHIKFFSEKTLSELLIGIGFTDLSFHNAGRVPWLWKSMICRCIKPAVQES